jgi:hypothetical protein
LEVERLSAENGSLHASIHHCKMIQTWQREGVLESQLQKLEEKFSISSAQLQEVS